MSASVPEASAVLFAKDRSILTLFYREVAGLHEISQAADHAVLGCGGFQLVVHQVPQQYAQHIVIKVPPVVRELTSIKLCFRVPSLEQARQAAARLGGALYGAEREWKSASAVICDGYDPEGNVYQLFQPLGG